LQKELGTFACRRVKLKTFHSRVLGLGQSRGDNTVAEGVAVAY